MVTPLLWGSGYGYTPFHYALFTLLRVWSCPSVVLWVCSRPSLGARGMVTPHFPVFLIWLRTFVMFSKNLIFNKKKIPKMSL